MNFLRVLRDCLVVAGLFATAVFAKGEMPSYPEHRVAFHSGVSGIGGLTYATYRGHRPLRMDLYFPPQHAQHEDWPLVVFIHGGAWRSGTPRGHTPGSRWPGMLASLSAAGFVIAAVEYRLDREGQFPAAAIDVQNAIAYLRSRAADYRIDPGRVAAWGPSAGGQLAALTATACGEQRLELPGPESTGALQCIQAAVSWYGVHDFRSVQTPPGETGPRFYLGCAASGCRDEELALASPAYYLDSGDAPMLLVHGLNDTLVDVDQTTDFAVAAGLAGVESGQVLIEGVDHGFESDSPALTESAYSRALVATCQFLWRQLSPRQDSGGNACANTGATSVAKKS